MKHFRILVFLLVLALVLSACANQRQEPYEYTFSLHGQVKTIKINPETQTILDGTDVYYYTVTEVGSGTDYDITYPNGGTYWWMSTKYSGHGGWGDNYDDNRYIPGDILIYALQENQPWERNGNIGIGLLLLGLGAVNFFIPELPFYLRYGWAVENAEPSDTYLTLTKGGGILAMILGLIQFFI